MYDISWVRGAVAFAQACLSFTFSDVCTSSLGSYRTIVLALGWDSRWVQTGCAHTFVA